MSMPIARGGWWTGAQEPLPPPPPPKPEHVSAHQQSASPTSRPLDVTASSPVVQGPLAPGSVRSLLPADAARAAEPKAHLTAGLEADDPRAEVIEQGYQVREIDRQVNALADQQIDIEGAQGRVQAAQAAQERFLTQVMDGLTPQQERELKPLADAATAAPNDPAAQEKFGRALQGVLEPEQQQKLLHVQRETENALIHLEGQQLGQRLIQAQSKGTQQELSLVTADARMYVSGVRQVEANRKLQDALAAVMTPENRQKLAAPEQKLRDAAAQVQSNPSDAEAQERLKAAQSEFDTALAGAVSSSDKHALDVLEAASQREQDLSALLTQEAETEHRYFDMSRKTRDSAGLNATEQRVLQLTNAQYELVKKQREIREIAVQAASSSDADHRQELLDKLDAAIGDVIRKRAEHNVDRAQFNVDVATENATTPVKVADEFAVGLPPTDFSVTAANQQLSLAKDQLAKLEDALKPPPPEPRGFWDRALEIGVGVLEVAVGAALTIGSGGLLAAAGVLIMADGVARTTHSIVDAVNGTTTDTYQSQAMQGLFGWDRGAANRVDAGISLLAMAPGMGVGAVKLLASAGKLAKLAGGVGAVTTLDTVQAQLRYAALNHHATPFTVQGLTSLGMSHTAANYVMLAGGVASTAGLMSAATRVRPGRTELAFKEFENPNAQAAHIPPAAHAAQAANVPPATRVADWYGRNAPEDVRRTVAAELLGRNASTKEIAHEANKLSNKSLVVIRESTDGGEVLAAAVLKGNARGRFGLDPVGDKVGKHTTEIRDVFGDDLSVQQAIAAAVVGVEKFTHQNAVTWSTTDSQDARLAPGAVLSGQRVRREALDRFDRMPEADRPEAVNAALASSSSPEAQLRALAEISTNDRYAWPAHTRDLVYKRVFNRQPELFGNETLGKIVHVMDKQSYVNQFNAWVNPAKRAVGLWEKSHPRVREIETFPAEGGRPAMAGTLNKPNSLDEAALYEIASASIESRRLLGADTDALSRIPAGERVSKVMDDLRGKDVITIRDEHGNLIAGGAISRRGDRSSDADAAYSTVTDRPRGTLHLSNLFTTGADGWGPLMSAAEKAAREQGARHLALDPALPHLIGLDPQASSLAQGWFWNTRDYLAHARDTMATKAGAFKDSLHNIDDPRLRALASAGRWTRSHASTWGHWLSEHLNPYSYPAGLEPGGWRATAQEIGYGARYMTTRGLHMGRNGVLLSLGPQAAAGQMYFVTNDDRTVLPFNGLPGSPSLALYFDWTNTMVTLWGNGPNLRGPMPLDENGLPPLLRVRPALNDPNGPNSAGLLGTARLILGGEVNLGIRYFGSNDGGSAQSVMSMRAGRVNSNLRADVPVQPGGPQGFSLIGSLTALAPSMSHAVYLGRFGATLRTPRVTMIGTLQTAPLSPADQSAAFRAGEHHTRAGKGVSGGSGLYFTLNPAYGRPDFTP
jgi:hypothetical protein